MNLISGVPEKVLRWPVGFTDPFKPNSRFEVINWKYFNNSAIFGSTDLEPVSEITEAEKLDLDEVKQTAVSVIKKELPKVQESDVELKTGYKRLDPKRGSFGIISKFLKILISDGKYLEII